MCAVSGYCVNNQQGKGLEPSASRYDGVPRSPARIEAGERQAQAEADHQRAGRALDPVGGGAEDAPDSAVRADQGDDREPDQLG